MRLIHVVASIAGAVAALVAGTVMGHRMQLREADLRISIHAPQLLIGGIPLNDSAAT